MTAPTANRIVKGAALAGAAALIVVIAHIPPKRAEIAIDAPPAVLVEATHPAAARAVGAAALRPHPAAARAVGAAALRPPPPQPPSLTAFAAAAAVAPGCTPMEAAIRSVPCGALAPGCVSRMMDWSLRSTCIGERPIQLDRDFHTGQLRVEQCNLLGTGADACPGPAIPLGEWCRQLRALPIPPLRSGTPALPHPGEGLPGGPPVLAGICP